MNIIIITEWSCIQIDDKTLTNNILIPIGHFVGNKLFYFFLFWEGGGDNRCEIHKNNVFNFIRQYYMIILYIL